MADKKKFTKSRKMVEVDIDDIPHFVREMGGDGLNKWMKLNAERIILKDGEPAGMKSIDNLQAKLICLCLSKQDGNLVSEDEIKDYPASVQMELFQMCQDINGLDREAQAREKKL